MQMTLVQRIQHSEPGANEEDGMSVCLSVCQYMYMRMCMYACIRVCVYLYYSIITLGDSVYLEKYRSVCRELELLKQQKNSEYDEELDDLRATKRNLERKVMNTVIGTYTTISTF